MLKSGWTRHAVTLVVLVVSLTSCAKGDSSAIVATPDLYKYSEGFQETAYQEISRLRSTGRPPCAREITVDEGRHCYAILQLLVDYYDTRSQVRAARGEDDDEN